MSHTCSSNTSISTQSSPVSMSGWESSSVCDPNI
jgi:hypothetical protein